MFKHVCNESNITYICEFQKMAYGWLGRIGECFKETYSNFLLNRDH